VRYESQNPFISPFLIFLIFAFFCVVNAAVTAFRHSWGYARPQISWAIAFILITAALEVSRALYDEYEQRKHLKSRYDRRSREEEEIIDALVPEMQRIGLALEESDPADQPPKEKGILAGWLGRMAH
jgi:hypothetical protein